MLVASAHGKVSCGTKPPWSVNASILQEFRMATWNGAETLGYNTVKEYDHPTGVYKVSGIVRPFADENTQRNTFYVLLSYSCDGEDVVSASA